MVMNGYKPWLETYYDIADYIHGQKMRAVLEDDPHYYYEGRFSVNSWKSDKDWSKITIDYNVSPYKMRKVDSKEVVTLEDGTVTRKIIGKDEFLLRNNKRLHMCHPKEHGKDKRRARVRRERVAAAEVCAEQKVEKSHKVSPHTSACE